MPNQEPGNTQSDMPSRAYRGAMAYRHEDGYKLVTMQVRLLEGEQSSVITYAYNLPIVQEAEHLSVHPPLVATDLYDFVATDGTSIMLTIESQEAKHTAVYSVRNTGIENYPSFIQLDIIKSNEERRSLTDEAQVPYDWQAAYDEALHYYKDSIPVWLNIQNKLDTTAREPFHDDESDFGLESRRKP